MKDDPALALSGDNLLALPAATDLIHNVILGHSFWRRYQLEDPVVYNSRRIFLPTES